MVTKQIAIETARAFVQECKAQGLPIDRAFLFGSYVNGIPHEGSDIDLLLVSKIFTDNIFTNLKTYAKINIRYPIIETHPVSLDSLTNGNEFIEQITREGVMIE